jgi:hypothetical protein
MRGFLILLIHVCCVLVFGDAPPHISFLSSYMGPDIGGFTLQIYGRNLGFLESDIKVIIGGIKVEEDLSIADGWESISFTAPTCTLCGEVDVVVIVGMARSNPLKFTYTSKCMSVTLYSELLRIIRRYLIVDICNGPLPQGEEAILPFPFSGKENCTGD